MPRTDPSRVEVRSRTVATSPYANIALALLGLLFGLALLKFGNPVIFEGRLPPPAGFSEILHFNWPIQWGWVLAALVGVLVLPLARGPRGVPRWLLMAPAAWLAWQWIAGLDSIQPALSRLTVMHFTSVVAFFYLGVFATAGIARSLVVWIGIGVGLCLVVSSGFQQRFGGLEAQREFAEKYLRGDLPADQQQAAEAAGFRRILETPEGRQKLLSKRIYGTLFYPNTLAGVILLLLPGLLAATWLGFRDASPLMRRILPTLLGVGALLCLVWSGSKAGWLIGLAQVGLLLMSTSIPAKWRRLVVVTVVVAGLAALVVRNLDYFQRGATSVTARTDYWASAGKAFLSNPLTGTGPGTFGEDYRARKAAESEMARLAHNDFIQQASDSGLPGFGCYLALVVGGLWWAFRRLRLPDTSLVGLVALGLLGWALQSLTEFGLYIPAIAWPAFFLLGSLVREAANRIDTPATTA